MITDLISNSLQSK